MTGLWTLLGLPNTVAGSLDSSKETTWRHDDGGNRPKVAKIEDANIDMWSVTTELATVSAELSKIDRALKGVVLSIKRAENEIAAVDFRN